MATNVDSGMLRLMCSPAKSRRKGVERFSSLVEGACTSVLCISRFLSEKSVLRENRKLGSNHTVKFSKGTWHHKKIAKERVHCGAFESVNLTRAIRVPQV